MSRDSAADLEINPAYSPARLSAVILLIVGAALIGAGALLWSRLGAAVFVDAPLLANLPWCG
jgi:hypothetical protein